MVLVVFARKTLPSSDEIYRFSHFDIAGDLRKKAIHAFNITGNYMGTLGANIPTHLRSKKTESKFYIGTYTSSKKIREIYESLPARDKQILHGICKSFSNEILL